MRYFIILSHWLFSIPIAVVARVLGEMFAKQVNEYQTSGYDKELVSYAHIKKEVIASLLEDAENQPKDNNAVYEKYIMPELQKWINKK